jgi:hypothetical protein
MEERMSVDKDLSVSEEEENAFEASFNATDLEPSALLAEPAPDEEPEPQEAPGTVEEPVPAAIPAGLTLDELKAMIENQQQEHIKTRDKFFGKIGELQQKIDAARSTVSTISPKARERLQADFPELADMLFDGDAEPAQPDPEYRYEPQEDKLDKVREEMELKLLTFKHKDWKTVVATPEFTQWKESVLDPESALELDSSRDSEFISDKLTAFKEWKANSQKKQTKPADNRLESAITPRGLPRGNSPSMLDNDEEAAMEAAFRKRN